VWPLSRHDIQRYQTRRHDASTRRPIQLHGALHHPRRLSTKEQHQHIHEDPYEPLPTNFVGQLLQLLVADPAHHILLLNCSRLSGEHLSYFNRLLFIE